MDLRAPVTTGDGYVDAGGVHTYLPERRGHGRTPDVEGRTGFAIMGADTVALMEALGAGPAHLVGWSDGAMVALEVALTRPGLVRRLALAIRQACARLSPDGADHVPVVFEKPGLANQLLLDFLVAP